MCFCLRGWDGGGVPPIVTIHSPISWEDAHLEPVQQPGLQGPDARQRMEEEGEAARCGSL